MAEPKNKEILSKNENPFEPKNIFSMLPKVDLKFPFFNQHSKKPEALVKKDEEIETPKPPSVYMGNRQKLPPPLEFEAEECVGRTSNPIVLWQFLSMRIYLHRRCEHIHLRILRAIASCPLGHSFWQCCYIRVWYMPLVVSFS
ncbi:hypothetical protein PTKIN_Ptkin16aG0082600 [Pterospermum kingtungense]